MMIKEAILKMASERGSVKSTCPSEIARALFPEDWRRHMAEVRDEAIELHQQGKVVVTQRGLPVDVGHIKGPVRIRIVDKA